MATRDYTERVGEITPRPRTLPDVIRRSSVLMPDRASADRLTEAVLLRAIAENNKGRLTDPRLQLMGMLDEEHRLRARRFLN